MCLYSPFKQGCVFSFFQTQKKRGELICYPFHASEALPIAYYSRADNVRAHADMKDTSPYNDTKEHTQSIYPIYHIRDAKIHIPGHLPLLSSGL